MNTSGTWLKFQNGTKSMKLQSASARQVSRNVWMLDAKNSLPLLLELSALANTCSLQYSAFLVEGEVTPLNGKTGGVAVIGPLKI